MNYNSSMQLQLIDAKSLTEQITNLQTKITELTNENDKLRRYNEDLSKAV